MEVYEIVVVVFNILLGLRVITSAIMCVYSCKWRKGLIATTSIYIGVGLAVLVLALLIESRIMDIEPAFIISVAIPFLFFILAYKWIWLNHFLTGFLVANKLLFMIIYRLMENGTIEDNFAILMIVPIIVGIIAGIIISCIFTYSAVLVCMVYIGAVDLVLSVSDIISKGLFIATSDISYVFDPEDIILKFFGVEIPSGIEIVFILIVGVASFILQKNQLDRAGIDLSDYIIDDRKKDLL